MRKRTRICFYVFLICAFCALGILGYFVLCGNGNEKTMMGPRKFVTFAEIPSASSYSVSASPTSPNSQIQENTYTINIEVYKESSIEKNEFKYKIKVLDDNNKKIAEESYVQTITNTYEENNTIDCTIENYKVNFYNGEEIVKSKTFDKQKLTAVNSNIFCCLISEYFDKLFVKDGSYNIVCTAFDEKKQILPEEQKEIFEYVAFDKEDFLRRENFFMNGNWQDYIISSKKELEQIVWHTILYREKNVSFYVDTKEINDTNLEILVDKYITSYPEYDAVDSMEINMENNSHVGSLENIVYYLNENFTETYKDLSSKNKRDYNYAMQFLHKNEKDLSQDYIKLAPTERTFEIDKNSNLKGVKVYNTEQLFMVTQYGEKPIFDDETSVASIVYQNALFALKKINNSNNLSEYEKALNIYRYICNNVAYDWVTYKYMEKQGNTYIINFGNMSCFYLEGVFYNNGTAFDDDNFEKTNFQFAVCDGLSKAYVLMCNIEGIDCYKVNGTVSEDATSQPGNHAWNKVRIEDAERGLNGWFNVDTTWGVASFKEEETIQEPVLTIGNTTYVREVTVTQYYQILTHTYFLRVGSEIRNITFQPDTTPVQNTIDYYKIMKYEFGLKSGDFNVESDNEFKNLLEYAVSQVKPKATLTDNQTPTNPETQPATENQTEPTTPTEPADTRKDFYIMEFKISVDYLYSNNKDNLGYKFLYFNNQNNYDTKTQNEIDKNAWFESAGLDQSKYSFEYFVTGNVVIFKILTAK